jgi:putative membrane protein
MARHYFFVMEDNNEMAQDRTDWAEDRTIMANERTFSAWMGTGLGAVGIAIGLKAVFGATDPTWVAKVVASLFLGVAILIYWMAQRQARLTFARLTEKDAAALPARHFTLLASVMTFATLATGAVLWSL